MNVECKEAQWYISLSTLQDYVATFSTHKSRLPPEADRVLLMVICLYLRSGKEPGLITFVTMVDTFRPISRLKISL